MISATIDRNQLLALRNMVKAIKRTARKAASTSARDMRSEAFKR